MCLQVLCCYRQLEDVNADSSQGQSQIAKYKLRLAVATVAMLAILALGLCAYYQVGSMANAFSHSGTLAMIYTPVAILGTSLLFHCIRGGSY